MSELQVTRFFKTRVDQELVGRLPSGERIPGGPYTLTQAIAAVVVGFLGLKTKPYWSTGNVFADLAIVAIAVVLVVVLLRLAVSSQPELMNLRVKGWARQAGELGSPPGIYAGKRYRQAPRGHRTAGSVLVDLREFDALTAQVAAESSQIEEQPAPVTAEHPVQDQSTPTTPVPVPVRARSGLDHLLASTNASH